MHTTTTHADLHQDAPTLQKEQNTAHSLLSCSPMLPPEVAEILQASTKPLSRKKLKKLEKERTQKEEIPLLAAMAKAVANSVTPT